MYQYALIKEQKISADNCGYQAYGIAAFAVHENYSQEIMHISDISTDKERLSLLIEKCNRLKVSPIHLKEIIEDFILSA